jgi:hypothetical protein
MRRLLSGKQTLQVGWESRFHSRDPWMGIDPKPLYDNTLSIRDVVGLDAKPCKLSRIYRKTVEVTRQSGTLETLGVRRIFSRAGAV